MEPVAQIRIPDHATIVQENLGRNRPTSYDNAMKNDFSNSICRNGNNTTHSSDNSNGNHKSKNVSAIKSVNNHLSEDSGFSSKPYAYAESFGRIQENQYEKFEDTGCFQKRKTHKLAARNNSASSESSLLSRTSETISENRFISCIIFSLAVVTIMSLVLVIFLFVNFFGLQRKFEDEKSERKRESNTFCVPCNDLLLGPLEEDNENLQLLKRQTKQGIEECCAKGANQTSILLDLLFKRREKLHQAQEIIDSESNCKCNSSSDTENSQSSSGKTSAHLLAGIQSSTDSGPQPHTLQNWIVSGAIAHSNGIQVSESKIIIDTSGLYLVYSQIYFTNLYKGQTANNTAQALYHYVYRWNIVYPNDGNEMLLKSVRTQCWAENRIYGDYTSYTAGVFKLNAGDNLFVKVSKIDLMSRDPHASFFGITKL